MMYTDRIQRNILRAQSSSCVTVLGIETSCDETAAAVVRNGREVLSNVIATQIPVHQRFGGVVPEVASRNHTLAINAVVEQALLQAGMALETLDAIAVTYGAGLLGALLVGVSTAKALALAQDLPLIAVNHIQAHICANYIAHPALQPPFLALVASGGHTAIMDCTDYNAFSVLGSTMDDAIGEAFDKVARILGLPYPGGPNVDRLAQKGEANISFYKHTKKADKHFALSYSGLKTAVINYVHRLRQAGKEIPVSDICASFSKSAVDLLVETTLLAAKEQERDSIVLSGGVAANTYLRAKLTAEGERQCRRVLCPPPELCTDNAAMVASRGYFGLKAGKNIADMTLNAVSNLQVWE